MPFKPGQSCITETKTAHLSSDFGYEYACKVFGQDVIDALPRYSKGRNVGKLKGAIEWTNCTRGGWDYGIGAVVLPGKAVRARILANAWGGSVVARGVWLGREQDLSGARCFLFEEGRARWAADEAKRKADMAQQLADSEKRRAAGKAANCVMKSIVLNALEHGYAIPETELFPLIHEVMESFDVEL